MAFFIFGVSAQDSDKKTPPTQLTLPTLQTPKTQLTRKTPQTPKDFLGFQPTDDKTIADWSQITGYFQKLAASSGRVKVETLGETTLKKPLIVAYISAEENIKNLDKYKQISTKLADPRLVKDSAERDKLIAEGKTIVAISCSIHSTEIVASQMSMLLAYELASANDEETRKILENTIILLIPSPNPDGIDIVANWYRKTLGTPFEGSNPPEIYHHYAGHDDNRDWFMLNLKETQLVTKLLWKEWFPQIVYDIHQQGQTASRFILPPFYDPSNPNIPPVILREVGTLGYKIAADLQTANIKGVATNAVYDTWWHGGFRSTPYFHNSIGILSEAASANLMSPVRITDDQLRQTSRQRGLNSPLEATTNHPAPWTGGIWTPHDIAEIEMISCRALLSMAANYRAHYLKNFYELNRLNSQFGANPSHPVGYVIPAGQGNEEAVSRFIEILISQGIEVFLMNRELKMSLYGTSVHQEIPLGSFIVFTAQPQRNNVQALFEKQVYPSRLDANGNAEVPYDVAGWTLPMQMGIEVLTSTAIVEYPNSARQLEKITDINQVRRQLSISEQKEPFAKLANPLKSQASSVGSQASKDRLQTSAVEKSNIQRQESKNGLSTPDSRLPTRRIGLYQGFTASMDEGWTRLVFDNFQISYTSLPDADVRKGELKAKFETIILPSQSEKDIVEGLPKGKYPAELTGGITENGAENLRKFVEEGGTLICFDNSCELAIKKFKLPLKNSLDSLKRSEFYGPGSIVSLDVDVKNPLAKGLNAKTNAYFINSSAFEEVQSLKSEVQSQSSNITVVARYAEKDLLQSGWLLGEKYLQGKIALAEADYGKGKIILFAFRPQHRGQTWATFPFIFNALEK